MWYTNYIKVAVTALLSLTLTGKLPVPETKRKILTINVRANAPSIALGIKSSELI